MQTEKGKAIARWSPSDRFKDGYDRIFKREKGCESCGGDLNAEALLSYPQIPYYTCHRCGKVYGEKKVPSGNLVLGDRSDNI